ncbi:MAG TPA: N-glycosylase/DNA lyase [Candidatus Omnitrophota bacterium]|nr:N-glycosylase/DNA lyase [Candidatus Omnitrophota bacterium]HPS20339.1 N-glycosylase/DNA lyase [Candidatus Omnitrophota bacterium]
MSDIDELLSLYKERRADIRSRLKEFFGLKDTSEKRLFEELCFCICTPQSNARYADKAIKHLVDTGLLYRGTFGEVRNGLKGVRFPNNKGKYIVEARDRFTVNGKISIRPRIDPKNIEVTRIWFVKNVKGLGFKEASHFLRNIGFGKDIAILDVHILRNMKIYGVIPETPKTLSPKIYLELEEKLRGFSGRIGIPMDELDLLFWSKNTGIIFK